MRSKPIIIIIIFFFSLISIVKSQEDFGVLYWTAERDLTWDDFKGNSIMDSSESFFLDIYIESLSEENQYYLPLTNNHKPKIYIFTNTSYANEEVRNDDLLRYFNVYFDLAAVYAFKVMRQQNKAKNSNDEFYASNLNLIKKAVVEEWYVESSRFVLETQYGLEIENLLIWEKEVNAKIKNIPEPIFTPSEYSYTFDFTLGPLIGLSDYKEYLTEPLAVVFGMEVAKAPFTFNFGISGNGQTVKKSFKKGNDEFLLNSEPNLLNIFCHTGYQLVKTKYLNITPRAGVHFSNLRYGEDDDFDDSAWAISYTGGLVADVKLFKKEYKYWNSITITNIGLRFGVYYYPMQFGVQDLSHVIVTAGLFWTAEGLDISYP